LNVVLYDKPEIRQERSSLVEKAADHCALQCQYRPVNSNARVRIATVISNLREIVISHVER
jgi:hypothetical protein